jgi:nitrate/nitrite transporter NarK
MGRHALEAAEALTAPMRVVMDERPGVPKRIINTILRYVKGIVAVMGAVGTTLAPLYIGDNYMDLPEQAQAVLAWLTALGIIAVPNKKKEK